MIPAQFRLLPGAWAAKKRQTIVASLVLGAVMCIFIYLKYTMGIEPAMVDKEKMYTVYVLFLLLGPVGIFRLLRRQRQAIEQFLLVIDEHTITAYPTLPTEVVLSKIEITQIIKNSDSSFVIIGGAGNTTINIPPQVEQADRLQAMLNEFAPVAVNPPGSFIGRYYKAVILAVTGVLILFIYTDNKLVLAISGVILLGMFAWGFVAFVSGRPGNDQTGKIKWWLLFMAAAVLAKMVYVMMA